MSEELEKTLGNVERNIKELRSSVEGYMDFGRALRALRDGLLVAREGWNGKGMFLYLVPGSTFKVNREPLLGIYSEGTEVTYQPHIDIRAADGKCRPWVASQDDLLATDWVIMF